MKQNAKTTMIQEVVDSNRLFYTQISKARQVLSFIPFMNINRLLIFNQTHGQLFYIEGLNKHPFGDKMPQVTKDVVNVSEAYFKLDQKQSQMVVEYQKKNDKGELQKGKWQCYFETKQLAKEWYQKLKSRKQKKQKPNYYNSQILNLGFTPETVNQKPRPQQKEFQITQVIRQQGNPFQSRITIRSDRVEEKNQAQSKINYQNSVEKSKDNSKEKHKVIKSTQSAVLPEKNDEKPIGAQSYIQNAKNIQKSSPDKSRISYVDFADLNMYSKITQTQKDWNKQYFLEKKQQTIYDFQLSAAKAFKKINLAQFNDKNISKTQIIQGLVCTYAIRFTQQAASIKREWRNYHFIAESTKDQFIIGVPLSCLIEFQGHVVLVKAPIARSAKIITFDKQLLKQIRDLQRYTRIQNDTLKNCKFYHIPQQYGSNNGNIVIYIDEVKNYLPMVEYEKKYHTYRPQLILQTVSQLIPGGTVKKENKNQLKIMKQIEQKIISLVKQLGDMLSTQQIRFYDYHKLKQFLHFYGLNLFHLGLIYNNITNKYIKKYVHTIMVAKVIKDYYYQAITNISPKQSLQKITEKTYKYIFQGNNNNSNELWKTIAINFKKYFNVPMNNHQIVGGFLLASLMSIISADYNLKAVIKNNEDKDKKLFKDEGIIQEGFVIKINPKIKSYNRLSNSTIDKIILTCKIFQYTNHQVHKDQVFTQNQIIETLQLKTKNIPQYFNMTFMKQQILAYLSSKSIPENMNSNSQLRRLKIYQLVNKEQPNSARLKTTDSYLFWCLQQNRFDQFKETVKISTAFTQFWYDSNHPFFAIIYQRLSAYYQKKGNNEQCMHYLKAALSNSLRCNGSVNNSVGAQYYNLAEKELRFGKKKQAMQNLTKAKQIMQANKSSQDKYGLVQVNLASLHLNNGNTEKCIEQCQLALKFFIGQKQSTNHDRQNIDLQIYKTFQILTRSYQINNNKNEIYNSAILCAKILNNTKSQFAYQQMLKICLTAAIFKNNKAKANTLLQLVKSAKSQQIMPYDKCIENLMEQSQRKCIMEKFLIKYDNFTRVLSEYNGRRIMSQESKELRSIIFNIVGCVGTEFLQGLIMQKTQEQLL